MTDHQNLSLSTEKQKQSAFRFSLAMAISMSLIAVLLVVTSGMPTKLLDLTALVIVVAIASVISTVLSRQGQNVLGILILIGSLLFACVSTAILFSGFGPVLAIVTLMISFGAGSSSLPRKYANLVNTISIALALGFILMDIFEPIQREPNSEPVLTWVVAGVLGVVFGIGILRNFNEYNFRTKLILSFIFMSVITLGVLAIFNQTSTSNLLTTNLGRELKGLAETRAQRIGDLINEQINSITIISLNQIVQDEIRFSNQSYAGDENTILAEIEALDQQWRAADAANNNNDPLVQEKLTSESAQELLAFKKSFSDNAEVFVTDKYGALTGTTNRTSDYYQGDEEWWQVAYNSGEGGIYVSDPSFDESLGAFSIVIAVPVVDEVTQQIIGVMRTTFLLTALTPILQEPIGETGSAEMYIPGEFPHIAPFYSRGESYIPVLGNTWEQLMAVANQPFAEIYYEGEDKIITQAPVSAFGSNQAIDNLGWFVLVSQNADEVLLPVKAQTRTALGLVILVVGVAAVIAVLLAQVLVAPITRLIATTQQISAGDLSVQAEITTRDEVGTLATAFNEMTDQLRNTLAGLEDRIAARTRDLELAAEVGRRLSLVSETEAMLTDAVNVIQDRFDLYYAQVYLADPTGRSLILRAGTGDVGQTLIRRGHRLPLDMGSLNGIAATERRTVIVADTETSAIHRPNPLLPDTRSEMAVPLLVAGRVVGVLDMQSSQPGALSLENQAAFEALAGSLAIAIANAELFEQAEAARTTVEEQARRLTSSGWQDFLDAIERSERVAFTYDRQRVTPLPEAIPDLSDPTDLEVPIEIAGATVGKFHFDRDDGWTEEDQAIVKAVSRQVGQQIDNLRLLAQSEQYQAAAQEALRQLTREGWAQYQDLFKNQQVGFVYSDFEVKPLSEDGTEAEKMLTYPIKVHDEAIGQIDILDTNNLSEEDAELVAFINEQLSAHLENLRLSQQTQIALAETEDQSQRLAALNELSEQLNNTENLQQILDTTLRYMNQIVPSDQCNITWPTEDGQFLEIFTLQEEAGAMPTGTRLPVQGTAVGTAFDERRVLRISDLSQSNYLENEQLIKQGIRSTMAVPLLATDKVLGTLNFGSAKPEAFDNRQRDLAIQTASLVSSIIENQDLFNQTQSALTQTEMMFGLGRQLNLASNETEILAATNHIIMSMGCRQSSLMYIDQDNTGKTEAIRIVAAWSRDNVGQSPIGVRFSAEQFPLMASFMAQPDKPLLVPDVAQAQEIDATLKGRWLSTGMKAMCIVPLGQAGHWLGLLTFGWGEPHEFSNQEISIFEGMVSLVAPTVQSVRLFEQTQDRARREQALRQITAAVRGSTDPATIMRTAVQELGNVLGRKTVIRLTQTDQDTDKELGNS
jgi:GAF domain-containing protein/HAMP domain-containing protein